MILVPDAVNLGACTFEGDGKVTVVNWPMTRLLLSFFANVYARGVTGLPLWE